MFKAGQKVICIKANNYLMKDSEYEIESIIFVEEDNKTFIDVGLRCFNACLTPFEYQLEQNMINKEGILYFNSDNFRILDEEWAEKILYEIEEEMSLISNVCLN
jgi:hypothetical protein